MSVPGSRADIPYTPPPVRALSTFQRIPKLRDGGGVGVPVAAGTWREKP